ncbi:MAG: pyridoxamine 5'-phosphate oxidase family protein [Burkholderiales bacterium]|nr:pyridoxamine 5'-phosphate oxidase family protein [Burkholderiales bacterium]
MTHEPAFARKLRLLLNEQRIAALGTLGADGAPMVSMVPFALAGADFVVHVSALAAHTANLVERPRVALMVVQAERPGEPVHALPRASFDAVARPLEPGSDAWKACRSSYLERFPEAEPMTELGDFRFMALAAERARQVTAFGAARSIEADDLLPLLRALRGRDAEP